MLPFEGFDDGERQRIIPYSRVSVVPRKNLCSDLDPEVPARYLDPLSGISSDFTLEAPVLPMETKDVSLSAIKVSNRQGTNK